MGEWGEELAKQYLLDKGWNYLESNWRCPLGEIDLIMQDGPDRVFVEVRLRKMGKYGSGADTVTWQKQCKLKRAVGVYQSKNGYWGSIRIDVISITLDDHKPQIEHIEWAVEE